jgi:hypothetical protein
METERATGAIVETHTCMHCGELFVGPPSGGPHRTGPQRRLNSCATQPYGFRAHAEGTECKPVACIGGMREVERIDRDESSVVP